MPATADPSAAAPVLFRAVDGGGHARQHTAACRVGALHAPADPLRGRRGRQDRDGDRRETRESRSPASPPAQDAGNPSGGGGGAGGMPLLVWIVMIEPGIVWPFGCGSDHLAVLRAAVDERGWSATWKPASFRRCRAASGVRPATLGTLDPGAAFDVSRVGRRQFDVAEAGGDRLHRGEPGAGRLVAAVEVAATALAQRRGAQVRRRAGVVVDVVGRRVLAGEADEAR